MRNLLWLVLIVGGLIFVAKVVPEIIAWNHAATSLDQIQIQEAP